MKTLERESIVLVWCGFVRNETKLWMHFIMNKIELHWKCTNNAELDLCWFKRLVGIVCLPVCVHNKIFETVSTMTSYCATPSSVPPCPLSAPPSIFSRRVLCFMVKWKDIAFDELFCCWKLILQNEITEMSKDFSIVLIIISCDIAPYFIYFIWHCICGTDTTHSESAIMRFPLLHTLQFKHSVREGELLL